MEFKLKILQLVSVSFKLPYIKRKIPHWQSGIRNTDGLLATDGLSLSPELGWRAIRMQTKALPEIYT